MPTLANYLTADNDVIAIDDTDLGTSENLSENVEFVEASVLDEHFPANAAVLFHIAALSSRNMHEENPQRGCRVNVEGFVNTVEQVRKQGCETVVYASTSSSTESGIIRYVPTKSRASQPFLMSQEAVSRAVLGGTPASSQCCRRR